MSEELEINAASEEASETEKVEAPKKKKAKSLVTVVYQGTANSLNVPDYGNAWGGDTITLVKGVAQEVPLELVKQLEGSVHASSLTVKE